jgi:hypothetical protein
VAPPGGVACHEDTIIHAQTSLSESVAPKEHPVYSKPIRTNLKAPLGAFYSHFNTQAKIKAQGAPMERLVWVQELFSKKRVFLRNSINSYQSRCDEVGP